MRNYLVVTCALSALLVVIHVLRFILEGPRVAADHFFVGATIVVVPPAVAGTAITCGPAVAGYVVGKIVRKATPEDVRRVLSGA